MPWSYFSRTDIVKPKKSFVELRDDEDLPPVPVPDYTMKFPQKERSTSGSESRRPLPSKKFINPKKGSNGEQDKSRMYLLAFQFKVRTNFNCFLFRSIDRFRLERTRISILKSMATKLNSIILKQLNNFFFFFC